MESPKSTKEKILEAAVSCFNNQGFGKTSLQDIARSLNISRGNLAYHFPTKDQLLEAIFNEMWAEIEAGQEKSRSFPSFQNLKSQVQIYLHYQKAYAFIFTDSQVMSIPFIREALQEMSRRTIEDNMGAIAFAMKIGNMKPEPFPGAYRQVAIATWMQMAFWQPQLDMRGITDEDPEKAVWSLILPHFTSEGIEAFKSVYGKEFYQTLGPAFDPDLNNYVML